MIEIVAGFILGVVVTIGSIAIWGTFYDGGESDWYPSKEEYE